MFFFVSTGLLKNRDAVKGSVFIEHLCQQLNEARKSQIELRRVMTRTLRAVEKEMDNAYGTTFLQYDDRMPYFISMLTRDLYFPPKKQEKSEK